MPKANCYLPNTTYLITRRCDRQEFLLKPSAFVNAVIFWVLAHAAQLIGLEVHAFCIMSNHEHLMVTDVEGKLPKFTQPFHKLVSAALNWFYRRKGRLFDGQRNYWIPLKTPEDILEKLVYVLTNPVAAGLVDRIEKWPGAWQAPLSERDAPKPEGYFRRDNNENFYRLVTTKPPGFEDMSDDEFMKLLWGRIRAREAEIAEEMRRAGRKFMGSERVLACSHLDTPSVIDTGGDIKPQVIAKDRKLRIELIKKLKEFRKHYYEALAQFRAGFIEVVFPAGTWQMVERFGVRCAEP